MRRYMSAMQRIASMAIEGNISGVWDKLRYWAHSEAEFYGLERRAQDQVQAPEARIPISIHPIEPAEADLTFVREIEKSHGSTKFEILRRYQMYQSGTPTCYVAVTDDNVPCYMQWMITSENNDFIQGYFDGHFPLLQPDEALLEMAFTHSDFRRNGIMSAAMARIAERGFERGIKRLITFVAVGNIGSLKGCKRAGFYPYTLGVETWHLFRRNTTFHDLPENGSNLEHFH